MYRVLHSARLIGVKARQGGDDWRGIVLHQVDGKNEKALGRLREMEVIAQGETSHEAILYKN